MMTLDYTAIVLAVLTMVRGWATWCTWLSGTASWNYGTTEHGVRESAFGRCAGFEVGVGYRLPPSHLGSARASTALTLGSASVLL